MGARFGGEASRATLSAGRAFANSSGAARDAPSSDVLASKFLKLSRTLDWLANAVTAITIKATTARSERSLFAATFNARSLNSSVCFTSSNNARNRTASSKYAVSPFFTAASARAHAAPVEVAASNAPPTSASVDMHVANVFGAVTSPSDALFPDTLDDPTASFKRAFTRSSALLSLSHVAKVFPSAVARDPRRRDTALVATNATNATLSQNCARARDCRKRCTFKSFAVPYSSAARDMRRFCSMSALFARSSRRLSSGTSSVGSSFLGDARGDAPRSASGVDAIAAVRREGVNARTRVVHCGFVSVSMRRHSTFLATFSSRECLHRLVAIRRSPDECECVLYVQ
mmetsp:Transcript_6431/g.21037  ORF Transcript_6431/g.21037 Transcript_6431/m.21037 type:complete len:345 (+) Transcript_6431:178-1212(+)